MVKKAVVRGEFHVSNTDQEALLNRDLKGFQALYLEGRSDIVKLHKYTNSYILFLIGYFSLELIYITSAIIHGRLLPFWAFNIEKEAQKRGIDVEDKIDLEIDEIYENFSPRLIHCSLVFFLLMFLVTFTGAFYEETLSFLGVSTPIPYWILPLIVVILLPLVYSGILICIGGEGERDRTMATSIDSIAEEKEHEEVLVLVGDKHVKPVSSELEERGWNVEKERSEHLLPRISRILER